MEAANHGVTVVFVQVNGPGGAVPMRDAKVERMEFPAAVVAFSVFKEAVLPSRKIRSRTASPARGYDV